MDFAATIVALVVILAIAWRFLGSYMAAVFEGRVRWLAFVERPVYRVLGVDPENVARGAVQPDVTEIAGLKNAILVVEE